MPDWITRAANRIAEAAELGLIRSGVANAEYRKSLVEFVGVTINAEFELYRQRVLVARDDGRDEQDDDGA